MVSKYQTAVSNIQAAIEWTCNQIQKGIDWITNQIAELERKLAKVIKKMQEFIEDFLAMIESWIDAAKKAVIKKIEEKAKLLTEAIAQAEADLAVEQAKNEV